jgi:hypothetical protein
MECDLVFAVFTLLNDHGLAIMIPLHRPAEISPVEILWVMTALFDDHLFFGRSWRGDWWSFDAE